MKLLKKSTPINKEGTGAITTQGEITTTMTKITRDIKKNIMKIPIKTLTNIMTHIISTIRKITIRLRTSTMRKRRTRREKRRKKRKKKP